MLTPGFAGELFGPGQPLDASRYYIIIPDAVGTGKSARPSDGLRASANTAMERLGLRVARLRRPPASGATA